MLDSILSFPKDKIDPDIEEQLLEITDRFNELGSQYQDTWSDSMWSLYDNIRQGFPETPSRKESIKNRLTDVIDIAVALSKNDDLAYSIQSKNALIELDEMSAKQKVPTINKGDEPIATRKCICSLL